MSFINRLNKPRLETIEQGAIFNCVSVLNYEKWPCCGIVITARCDLAHNKASVINYLPVVPYEAWLKQELIPLILTDISKSLKKSLDSNLRTNFGITQSLLDTFPIEQIIQKEVQNVSQRKKMLEDFNKIKTSEQILQNPSFNNSLPAKELLNEKEVKKQIERLVKQEFSEYYFISHLDSYEKNNLSPSVVLLRYMQTITLSQMFKISKGVEQDEIENNSISHLTFDFEPICMVTGVLRSPDIEHLAQTFSRLYTRIGLEDQESDVIEVCLSKARN